MAKVKSVTAGSFCCKANENPRVALKPGTENSFKSHLCARIKVALYCLALPSLAFNYRLPGSVTEKPLLQTSECLIS